MAGMGGVGGRRGVSRLRPVSSYQALADKVATHTGSRRMEQMQVVRMLAALLLVLVTSGAGSHTLAQAQGPPPTPAPPAQAPRLFDPAHIKLPDGYGIEVVVANLSVPTTAIFDGNDLLVAESGWVNTALPRILRIKPD